VTDSAKDGNDRGAALPQLFSRAPWRTDALDLFVGRCLTSGGIWSHPRTSDGIPSIERVFDRGPDALGVCARIYEIDDQSLHTFWLEIKPDPDNARFTWSLYFDVTSLRARRPRAHTA